MPSPPRDPAPLLRSPILFSASGPTLQLVFLATRPHVRTQHPFDIGALAHLKCALPDLVRPHLEPGPHLCQGHFLMGGLKKDVVPAFIENQADSSAHLRFDDTVMTVMTATYSPEAQEITLVAESHHPLAVVLGRWE